MNEAKKFLHRPDTLYKRGAMIGYNAMGKVSKDGETTTKLLKTIGIKDTGSYEENLRRARARFGKELKGHNLKAWNRYGDYIECADPNAIKEV